MGTDYALACTDCLEFIALHKWSIVDYWSLPSTRIPRLSNQPIVPVSTIQLRESLNNFVSPQPYIEKLLPCVDNFIVVLINFRTISFIRSGDWGLGTGDWGLGS